MHRMLVDGTLRTNLLCCLRICLEVANNEQKHRGRSSVKKSIAGRLHPIYWSAVVDDGDGDSDGDDDDDDDGHDDDGHDDDGHDDDDDDDTYIWHAEKHLDASCPTIRRRVITIYEFPVDQQRSRIQLSTHASTSYHQSRQQK